MPKLSSLPHLSNASQGKSFAGLVRNLRRRGQHFVDHGTPIGVSRRKASLAEAQNELGRQAQSHSSLASELNEYKDSLQNLRTTLQNNPMRSRAGGLYDMSGHATKLPSAYASDAAQKDAKRLAMKKLRKAKNGPHAVQIVAEHDAKAVNRIKDMAAKSSDRLSRGQRHVETQQSLVRDAIRNSRRNMAVGGAATGAAAGGAVYATQRNKSEEDRPNPFFTRQTMR